MLVGEVSSDIHVKIIRQNRTGFGKFLPGNNDKKIPPYSLTTVWRTGAKLHNEDLILAVQH